MLEAWGRRAILKLAGSRRVGAFVRRYGRAFGAARFVAGETPAAALEAVRALNRRGIMATLDHLGESVADPRAAVEAAAVCAQLFDAIADGGVRANVSLKLTQMGLDLDPALCLENLGRVLERARAHGNFVRIDMEDSAHTQATLDLYRELRRAGWDNVGIVVQSYLYRSQTDLESLDELRPNVRLVKGAYNEPGTVAFPARADVDANLRRLIERQLSQGLYTCVATHDEGIIAFTRELVRRLATPTDRFEFQMLYGIRPGLQRRLAAAGYQVRVYVPFGSEWYPYLMRRLAERPANLLFVLRSLLRR